MKKNSLKTYLLLYLMVFSFSILALFLIFQFTFLNGYYKYFKKSAMKNVAREVVDTYYRSQDKYDLINMLSYKNNVCIEILTDDETLYTSGASNGCISSNSELVNKNKQKFIATNDISTTFTYKNTNFNSEVLVYGERLRDGNYVFISTSLQLSSSVTSLLTGQLIFGTIIVSIISFAIAYLISSKISEPISNITKESKKMASGDYNVYFEESGIEEINSLAQTLNNTSKELSNTEKLRRELLANVSHDLKTPLTLIKANAEMVKDLTYKNEEKRNANLDVIVNEVDRLNLLVEDILTLSKTQSDTMKLEIKKVNLNELIESILTRYKVLQERDGYKIELNIDNNYIIKCDIKRLEQVIYNLINNAINYTVKDKKVLVNVKDNKETIRVEIIDTGKGIKDEDLKYIWDKYYKVDKSYHRVTVGTGLGLSIVKNILELHKFHYGVETRDKGTNFYFDIPK